MLQVALADDEFLIRKAVLAVLADAPDVTVVATCVNTAELDEALETSSVDVVVTDIRMPPSHTDEGIRFANAQREARPGLGVVVLSQHDDPAYALRLLDGGVARRAFLLKERVGHPQELVAAIQAVATGGSVVDPRVVERLVAARSQQERSPLRHLTPREREVVEQMAMGRNNATIADELHITERAVLKHINAIFAKFGLGDEPTAHKRVVAVLRYLSASGASDA